LLASEYIDTNVADAQLMPFPHKTGTPACAGTLTHQTETINASGSIVHRMLCRGEERLSGSTEIKGMRGILSLTLNRRMIRLY